MKILHLLKIAFLIFLIFALSKIEVTFGPFLTALPYILYGLCLVLLIGAWFWFVKIKKVKLFIIPILALFMAIQPAQAAFLGIGENERYEASRIDSLSEAMKVGKEVCSKLNEQAMDEITHQKAIEVLDYFNSVNLGGGLLGDDSIAKCANEYLTMASEIKKAQKATCSPTAAILKDIAIRDKCWPCDVTSTIIAAIQKVSIQTHKKLNDGAKVLLGAIYLMWLALTILISFAKFGFEKFAEFFTKLINQTIIVIIIAMILHAPLVEFYRLTISPFITYSATLGMRFSEIAQKEMGGSNNLFQKIIDALDLGAASKCNYCDKMKDNINKEVTAGQFIDSASINGILCVTCSTYRQAAPMIALGQAMICLGRTTPQTLGQLPLLSRISQFTTPNASVSLMGYVLVGIFSFFSFLVGYFIMSSVFKLGVVFVLMPLFLVAYAFKISRPYATKAWGLIVFAMGTILIISIFSTMMIIGFASLMPDTSINTFIMLFFANEGGMMADMFGGVSLFEKIGMAKTTEEAINSVAGGIVTQAVFIQVLTMTSFGFICLSVLSGASELAEQITNSWQLNNRDTQNLGSGVQQAFSQSSKMAKAALGGTMALGNKALHRVVKDENGNVVSSTRQSWEERQKEADRVQQDYANGGKEDKKQVNTDIFGKDKIPIDKRGTTFDPFKIDNDNS